MQRQVQVRLRSMQVLKETIRDAADVEFLPMSYANMHLAAK